MQAVGQDMQLRLAPGEELAIHPDPAVAVIERQQGHVWNLRAMV